MKKNKRSSSAKLLRMQRTEDNKRARDNVKAIDKPRKKVAPSFSAQFDGQECPKCFLAISKGETVRYNEDGFLVHVRHEKKEIAYIICDNCFLALPCECD